MMFVAEFLDKKYINEVNNNWKNYCFEFLENINICEFWELLS